MRNLSLYSGVALIVVFCAFTSIAILLYPPPFSPADNWLSDLGNTRLNPQGNWSFNLGCIFTGLLLFPFFYGLDIWKRRDARADGMLMAGRGLGYFSALSLIMIGVFCEDHGDMHLLWSGAFFISLFLVMIDLNLSLFNNKSFMKFIGYYGFLVIAADIVLIALKTLSLLEGSTLPLNVLFEWLTVFSGLAWVGLVAFNMRMLPACGCNVPAGA